ncbi:MAG: hypothetical protein FJY98_00735 [Candidatus Liptonbacteria bacterium]|nr:hypothetical protein [Candidatus Liptonbacteria bacterium]
MPKAKTKKATKKVSKPAKALKSIGVVTHFYGNLSVAIVKFKQTVKTGVGLHYKGATTDFKETVKSMQYDHKPIAAAKKGQEVGIRVKKKVREGDEVFEAE